MNTKKRNIVILGAGESGIGAALLARQQDFNVFVSDKGVIRPEFVATLEEAGISFEAGTHSLDKIYLADEVIKSPGIPDHIALIKDIKAKQIPIISEIEFASRYTNSTIVGITGSNGKTTTTKLLTIILEIAGFDVAMVGNVGVSFARSLVDQKEREVFVLELSSFQLDGISKFRPNISMILNITPDHLDRYDYKMDNYIASKFRIMMNQKEEDHFLYNGDDLNIIQKMGTVHSRAKKQELKVAAIIKEKEQLKIGDKVFSFKNTALIGMHNYMNALFAINTALLLGARQEAIQKGLEAFKPVPHRLEKVAEIEHVTYYNDSKATNVEAVFFALQAMLQPTVWIVGGQDKGNDYNILKELVEQKVKAMICLGVDNSKILDAFKELEVPKFEVRSAEEAVHKAYKIAESGEVVLLSPACASFDLFKNYEQRGDLFRTAVNELKSQKINRSHEFSS